MRAVIVGSGSDIAKNLVTNEALSRIMDTNDAWIRERSGIETRYYIDPGQSTSDLAVAAAQRALDHAGVAPSEIDLVVSATMTPDHFFPGNGGLIQTRLGIPPVPCFDIRQQCSGFIYAMGLVDAYVRTGMAKTALIVGAEVHSGFMPWKEGSQRRLAGEVDAPLAEGEWEVNTESRHLTVLFGDAGAAVVVKAMDDNGRGVIDHILRADGADANKLYVPGVGFKHRPYVSEQQLAAHQYVPHMDGRYVFKMATTRMGEVADEILKRNNLAVSDLSMVLMHQANKRINEYVQKMLGLPDDKVIHNIHKYGNTTAATIPLLWDEAARTGRIKAGDLVLMVAFGAGMTWGATLLRA